MEVSGQHHAPAVLSPGKTQVPIEYEAWLAPKPVRTFWRTENSLTPAEI
jgi:hypothetical protein